MGYVVYVDLVFIVNFFMDALLLYTLARIIKRKRNFFRLLTASLIGAAGSLLKVYRIPIPYIIIVIIMIFIAYDGIRKKERWKAVIYFYGLNLMIGGCVFFLKEQKMIKDSIGQLFIVVIIAAFAGTKGIRFFLKQTGIIKNLYAIEFLSGGKMGYGMALLDTGNRLYDPYFHRPVIIGEYEAMKEIYDSYDKEKLLWIPYHSLGNDNGMICAVKIEKLWIQQDKEKILQENVLIAVNKGRLSSENKYQFILHEDYLHTGF